MKYFLIDNQIKLNTLDAVPQKILYFNLLKKENQYYNNEFLFE